MRSSGLVRAATACLAAVALGGCGDSGGDEETYVRTYESACKTIIDVPERARTEAEGIDPSQGRAAAIEEYKEVLRTVFADMERAFDQMIGAEAPEKWADFQKSVSESGDEAKRAFDEVDQRLEEAETLDDISKVGENLDFQVDTDDLPADLAQAAPSCKTLDES
jgi:hypothetical protein